MFGFGKQPQKKHSLVKKKQDVVVAGSEKSNLSAKAEGFGEKITRSFNLFGNMFGAVQGADTTVATLKVDSDPHALEKAIRSPMIRSGIEVSKNRVVGSKFKLQLSPSVQFFNDEVKKELILWAAKVERMFELYANSPEKYIDAERKMSFTEILRQTVSQDLIFGEHFLLRTARKDTKMGVSFCVQAVEPWRVRTPMGVMDSEKITMGIVKDELGASKAYCVYNALPDFLKLNYTPENWRIINRESTILINNREVDLFNMLHGFTPFRPNQTRGYSEISTILPLIDQLDKARGYALQSMNLALKYAFYLEADPKTDLMRDVFASHVESMVSCNEEAINNLMIEMQDWQRVVYDRFKTKFDSVDVPQLTPGEKINVLAPHQNALNAHGMISDNTFTIAKAFGLSKESLSGDFRDSNYSSSRMSEALTWEGIKAKREVSVNVAATTIFRAWADEMALRGLLPDLPASVDYWLNREILLNCEWIGAGKIIVDENKYASATKTMLDAGLTTIRDSLNEQGKDLDDVLEQIAFEQQRKAELGIDAPQTQTTNQFFDLQGA